MTRQNQISSPLVGRPCRSGNPWTYPLRPIAATGCVLLSLAGCSLAQRRSDPSPQQTTSTSTPSAAQSTPPGADSQSQAPGQDVTFHANATIRQKFQVHLDFGRVFESEGNFDAAIMEYQDALNVFKDRKQGGLNSADQALAHRRIGGAFDKLGRFAQAEEHYKQALKLDPKNAKIWNDAGYSYYLQGKLAQAQQALLTGNKLAPDDPKIRINLGLTLAAAGLTADALPLLSETPGDAVGHVNLGYQLASNQQYELARKQYETALAMRPDLEIARRALAQLDRQENGTSNVSLPPIQVTAAPQPPVTPAPQPPVTAAAKSPVTVAPKPPVTAAPKPPVIVAPDRQVVQASTPTPVAQPKPQPQSKPNTNPARPIIPPPVIPKLSMFPPSSTSGLPALPAAPDAR